MPPIATPYRAFTQRFIFPKQELKRLKMVRNSGCTFELRERKFTENGGSESSANWPTCLAPTGFLMLCSCCSMCTGDCINNLPTRMEPEALHACSELACLSQAALG